MIKFVQNIHWTQEPAAFEGEEEACELLRKKEW